jgi:hypothetical protein
VLFSACRCLKNRAIRPKSSVYSLSLLAMDINRHRCYKLGRFAHNWPPAPRAYAPEGMLKQWQRYNQELL